MKKAFVSNGYTKKKIFIQHHYASITKAMLSLPIFNLKQRTAPFLELKIGKIAQYTNITISSHVLSLDIDFNVFVFLSIQANTIQQKTFKFHIDELFEFMGVSVKNKINYTPKVLKSLEKLKVLTFSFDVDNCHYICGLLDSAEYNIESKEITIVMSDNYKNLFIADRNQIYNISRDKYNQLEGEYEKALYLFYISNNANVLNTYWVDLLKLRLQCQNLEDKKFIFNVRKANNALIEKGLIFEAMENKIGRVTVSFSVNVGKFKPFKNQQYKKEEVTVAEQHIGTVEDEERKAKDAENKKEQGKIEYGYKRPEAELIEEKDDDIPF
ncbi:hypothetical protein SOJ50_11325 [Pseudomonas aeruginosa]|uniref:RepB family plasmid replication initiator protein n=1 Tax=Pseudomonas aeruginosa TaxID=287 RepID=UPI002A6B8861|nr:RepB family plasmid replication initiator protein [Pseudomonas aeruginosa]MDY1525649.1 hypothetical protein [Pseudomonas aeruginosa]MDY1538784.1 hypothetical protein [Pseudomonas aeruginosa]